MSASRDQLPRLPRFPLFPLVPLVCLGVLVAGPARAEAPPAHCHPAAPAPAPPPEETRAEVSAVDVPLTNQRGEQVRFRSQAPGEDIVVVDFVFTSCTTVCPVLSAILARVQERLGERVGKGVRLVSVSIDPRRDTPARLKEYAARYRARPGWSWLTGQPAEVERLLKGMGVWTADRGSHPPVVLVGDPRSGRWTRMNGFPSTEAILAQVESLTAARSRGGNP